ncbi:hypothetical protein [Cellulomonas taurus]|uniref:hypothetical protein n=1 Tax=Cellulomonas taurus TaxID=2729175 RepID=UPI0019815B03|nr:hypothetical protein [Cellulomonas taurus]
MSWAATAAGGEVHVLPVNDTVAHEHTDACVCGPTTEPVPRPDGSFGWLITHDALDGREHAERGETIPSEAP